MMWFNPIHDVQFIDHNFNEYSNIWKIVSENLNFIKFFCDCDFKWKVRGEE